MNVLAWALALALDDKVLALALTEKSWPWPSQDQDFSPKTLHPTWLLYACMLCSLLTLRVSHDSLPYLVFNGLHSRPHHFVI